MSIYEFIDMAVMGVGKAITGGVVNIVWSEGTTHKGQYYQRYSTSLLFWVTVPA